jgi:hypothetical protein
MMPIGEEKKITFTYSMHFTPFLQMFANVENTYIIETIPCLTDIWVLVEYTREEEHLRPEMDHTYFGGEMEKSTPFCVELPCVSTSIKEITHQLNILTGHSSLDSSCACRDTNGEKARSLISTKSSPPDETATSVRVRQPTTVQCRTKRRRILLMELSNFYKEGKERD